MQAKDEEYFTSIAFLSRCLEKAYGKKTIILFDEYDVPLESAHYNGFYDEMINFIRSLFESAMKTNPHLEFAVITGCLRISKESIFTGLNNPSMVSILDERYDEYFGFTPDEVAAMAEYYGHTGRMEDIRDWYDGYIFGNAEVYNPWSVINCMADLNANRNSRLKPYWANTSSNVIVKDLINQADSAAKGELETLMAGGTIVKTVHEDITYGEVRESQDNLWNFLFFTGYLKKVGQTGKKKLELELAIPNTEVEIIYETHIQNWFENSVKVQDLSGLYKALLDGEAAAFEEGLTPLLWKSISYMDNQDKESFYHGFMLGVLMNLGETHRIKSNREAGDGRYDICVSPVSVRKPAIIIELKVAKTIDELEDATERAMKQIIDKKYDEEVYADGYRQCWHVGIGFFKKDCCVDMKFFDLRNSL